MRSPRIAAGDYYEAHQQLRTISSRYVKAQDWDSAFDVSHGGAVALLKAGQGGSGGDLGCMLVDILGKSGKPVDGAVKSAFPAPRGSLAIRWIRGEAFDVEAKTIYWLGQTSY